MRHIHMRDILRLFLAAVLFIGLPDTLYAKESVNKSDKLKAEFLLNQATKHSSKENGVLAYYLLRQAHRLDPENDFILYNLGGTENDPKKAVEYMRPYAEANHDDQYIVVPYIGALYMAGEIEDAFRQIDRLIEIYPENQQLLSLKLDMCFQSDSVCKPDDTIDAIENLGADPLQIAFLRLIAMSLAESPDTTALISYIDNFAAEKPDDLRRKLLQADIYSVTKRTDDAITLLENALPASTDKISIYHKLAEIYYSIGDTINFNKSILREINQPEAVPAEIAQSIADTQFAPIAALLDTLSIRNPQDTLLNAVLFDHAIKTNDAKKAVEYGTKAIKKDDAVRKYYLMLAHLQLSNPDEALKIYQEAKDSGNEIPEANNLLLQIYAQKGDITGFKSVRDSLLRDALPGIADYDSLPDINYERAFTDTNVPLSTYLMEAEMYRNAGDIDNMKRASEYTLMLSTPFNSSLALNNYAFFLAQSSDDPEQLAKALEMARQAIRQDPSENNFDTLAWILFRMKRYSQAREIMECVVENLEQRGTIAGEFYDHLADIYAESGEKDKALTYWDKALKADADNIVIKDKMAQGKYIPEPFPPIKNR